jgi:hypothetical protein
MAMDALTATAATREKAAAKAMRSAATAAAEHTSSAKKLRSLPPVTPEKQCEVISMEQIKYVRSRRQN